MNPLDNPVLFAVFAWGHGRRRSQKAVTELPGQGQ